MDALVEIKKNLLDITNSQEKYENDDVYRKKCDIIISDLNTLYGMKYKQHINVFLSVVQASDTRQIYMNVCKSMFAIRESIGSEFNFKEIDRQISILKSNTEASQELRKIVQPYIRASRDRTIIYIIMYTFAIPLFALCAGILVASGLQNRQLSNEAVEFASIMVAFGLFIPFYMIHKFIKTIRSPTIHPNMIVYIFALALVSAGVYKYAYLSTVVGHIADVRLYMEYLSYGFKEYWLFSSVFVVYAIHMVLHTRILILTELLDGLSDMDEIGGWISTAVIVVIAVLVSLVVKPLIYVVGKLLLLI